jgi:hypothetical protein
MFYIKNLMEWRMIVVRKPKIKALIACVCIVCVLCSSLFAQVQNSSAISENSGAVRAEAEATALRDVHNDINGTGWYFIGCLGGVLGVLVAYVFDSNVPAARLIGKSSEYAIAYSDTYLREAKKIKTKKAWSGCITFGVVYAVYVVVVAIVASSNTTTSN